MVKRFYKTVTVEKGDTGFKVLCDNKPLKCGATKDLIAPNEVLAKMLAAEWDGQQENIDLKKMPVTDFVSGLNGLDENMRAKLIEDSIGFIDTDVLFYRAAYPASLIERQNLSWDKVLTWASNIFGVSFQVTNTVSPVHQSEKTLSAVSEALKALSDFDLLCFYKFSSDTTSVLLGLAVINGFLSAQEAFNVSRLEEDFQNEFWGKDSEADMAKNNILNDILLTEQIFKTEQK